MADGVWLVTGVQAAGKSTIADLLARQFEHGVHVRGGQFYRWAVRGWVHVGDARADEARRLLHLRYRLAALAADEYWEAGFTTVVQDNIFGADVLRWLDCVAARPRHLVVLRPSIAVVRQREQGRHAATGKTAYRPGEFTAEDLDQQLAATPRIGLWLDTSAMSPAETVRRFSGARPRLSSTRPSPGVSARPTSEDPRPGLATRGGRYAAYGHSMRFSLPCRGVSRCAVSSVGNLWGRPQRSSLWGFCGHFGDHGQLGSDQRWPCQAARWRSGRYFA